MKKQTRDKAKYILIIFMLLTFILSLLPNFLKR